MGVGRKNRLGTRIFKRINRLRDGNDFHNGREFALPSLIRHGILATPPRLQAVFRLLSNICKESAFAFSTLPAQMVNPRFQRR